LEEHAEHFLLRDLDSGSGTYVDGTQVVAERLKHGTTIYAGEAVLYFQEVKGNWPAEVELLEAGVGEDLSNEVRRIYESSVTYLAEPDTREEGRTVARNALSALYQVGRLAGGESALESLFEGVARILLEALSATSCILLLTEGAGRFRRAAVARGGAGGVGEGAPPAQILSRTASEGLSILIREAGRDPRFPAGTVGSVLCVPLKAARKVLGAIYCDVAPGGKTFDENDLKLATAVGRQAGGAVERRILEERLYEESQQLEARVAERTSELAQALADLKTAQARLVLSEKLAAVGMLVQGIAHNMATPLSGILGYAQVLKSRHPDLDQLDEIVKLCRHLDRIIENLLMKGRHDSSTKPECVDLNALVDETLKFFESDLFYKHEVEIILEMDGNLPAIWGIWGDFAQCVQNLIRNGLDAMFAAPRKVLTVRTSQVEDSALIEVEDSGCGIPHDEVGKIFDPFFSTKEGKGMGLGLFTTRNLLAPYGAEIHARSGGGMTVFQVRIPLDGAEETGGDGSARRV
jgi:signal transduction histidine kinase